MIKLTDDQGRRIVLCLAMLQELLTQEGANWREEWRRILEDFQDSYQGDDPQWNPRNHRTSLLGMAAVIFRNYEWTDGWSLQSLQEDLHRAMQFWDPDYESDPARKRTSEDERTLIEHVAEMVSSPLSRNTIHANDLEQIRKALLDPTEIAKLKQDRHRLARCADCGCEFMLREEMVVNQLDEQNRQWVLYCSRCNPPRYRQCRQYQCTAKALLPNSYCTEHAQQEDREQQQEAPAPFAPVRVDAVLRAANMIPRRRR